MRWYVGIPGSGKTSLAKLHLAALVARNGWPAIVLDSSSVEQLVDVPHARNVEELLDWVFGAGMNAAYVPRSREDVDAIARACRDPGRVNLLVDEAHSWLSARRDVDGPLVALMRAHRHSSVNLLLTTQHFTADIPQEARSCSPRIYIFRCTSPRVLEALREEGVDPLQVAELERLRFVEHYRGF